MSASVIGASLPHTGAVVVTQTSPLWYSTRATGLIALVLITMSLVLGLLTSVRFARPAWPRVRTRYGSPHGKGKPLADPTSRTSTWPTPP